jgi:hypothetical protein
VTPTPNVLEYTTSTNSIPLVVPTSLTKTNEGAADGMLLGLDDGEEVTPTGFLDGAVVSTTGLLDGAAVTITGLLDGAVVTTTGLLDGAVVATAGLTEAVAALVGCDVGAPVDDESGDSVVGLDVTGAAEGIGISVGTGLAAGANDG